MDGENKGKPYEQMDDLGVPLFWKHPNIIVSTWKSDSWAKLFFVVVFAKGELCHFQKLWAYLEFCTASTSDINDAWCTMNSTSLGCVGCGGSSLGCFWMSCFFWYLLFSGCGLELSYEARQILFSDIVFLNSCGLHPQKASMTMENSNHLNMYLLLKMVIFQLVMLVFGGVALSFRLGNAKSNLVCQPWCSQLFSMVSHFRSNGAYRNLQPKKTSAFDFLPTS